MDAFSLLTGGLSFQREKKKQFPSGSGVGDGTQGSNRSVAESLNFFGGDEASKKSERSKNKRKRKVAPSEEEQEDSTPTQDVEEDIEESVELDITNKEEVAAFRRSRRIFVKGGDVPPPLPTFESFIDAGLKPKLLKGLKHAGYGSPTAIQMQAIPVMLSGREVLGIAPTGSGKTMAFLLPMLSQLGKPSSKGFRGCIVAPTRELAIQVNIIGVNITKECKKINNLGLRVFHLEKSNMANFSNKSSKTFDLLVATPMRLVGGLSKGLVDLSHVRHLVIDEADRLFENGFEKQIDEIIAACSSKKRTLSLFSATMPERVETLSRSVLKDPIRVMIGGRQNATADIDQKLEFVGREDGKIVAMQQLIHSGLRPPVLIFVQDKKRAEELYNELVYEKVGLDVIHAGRTKQQRDSIVKDFRCGKVWVLICTDLMARGVDFKGVNMVINYDFPPSAVDYIHRIGRTGRAGNKGTALTLFTVKDAPMLRTIANVMKSSGCEVPDWMLELQKKSKRKRTRTIERPSITAAKPQ